MLVEVLHVVTHLPLLARQVRVGARVEQSLADITQMEKQFQIGKGVVARVRLGLGLERFLSGDPGIGLGLTVV